MNQLEKSELQSDDLNFLRFLTASLPQSIEDSLLGPLFRPLTTQQLHSHFNKFTSNVYPCGSTKKNHLYIHIPFCATVCSFCHCHHEELKNHQKLSQYVDFVIKQINEFSGAFDKRAFGSFTILGGTASLLSASEIKMLYSAAMDKFHFSANAIFSFEGHPSSLSNDKLDVLREFGVTRIHLGVQSLDEAVLKKINRFQSKTVVQRCIKNIKKRGFSSINVDLVAGLPGQTTAIFLNDIKTLIGWGVDFFNINPFSDITSASCFNKGSVTLQEVLSRRNDMIHQGKIMLESKGYINNWQRGYMLKGDGVVKSDSQIFPGGVLGLGLLAKSNLPGELVFQALPVGNDFSKVRYVGYPIDQKYSMARYTMLHLLSGLNIKAFQRIFGKSITSVFGKEISSLLKQGIISKNKYTYRYCGTRSLKDLYNYFVNSKVFLGKKIITELRMLYGSQYKASRNYGSNDDLLKVFQDFEFARVYYQLGKKTLWL